MNADFFRALAELASQESLAIKEEQGFLLPQGPVTALIGLFRFGQHISRSEPEGSQG